MRKCALASTRLHTHINTHTFLVMIHFFWNYRPTLRNVLPFGTAALHKNDEQKKWLLKECDDDDDVLLVHMKIPQTRGEVVIRALMRRPQIGSSLSKNRPDYTPSPFLTHALSFSFLLHRLTD